MEEHDQCLECGEGTMQFPEVENCSCHLSAPCYAHTSLELTCNLCGATEDRTAPIPAAKYEPFGCEYNSDRFIGIDHPDNAYKAEIDYLYTRNMYGLNALWCRCWHQDDFGNMYFVERANPYEVNYDSLPHSTCSMLKVGWAPPWVTRDEIEKEVRGTFGGRFSKFHNGQFEYIAYTD